MRAWNTAFVQGGGYIRLYNWDGGFFESGSVVQVGGIQISALVSWCFSFENQSVELRTTDGRCHRVVFGGYPDTAEAIVQFLDEIEDYFGLEVKQ